jgi:hypothetical protein
LFFETWLDRNRKEDLEKRSQGSKESQWINNLLALKEKDLRQFLDLITLSCILLAAKTNEKSTSIPTIREMQQIIRFRYTNEEFIHTEKYLLMHCLLWNLNITTPYHLSDALQGIGCLFWSDFEPELRSRIE